MRKQKWTTTSLDEIEKLLFTETQEYLKQEVIIEAQSESKLKTDPTPVSVPVKKKRGRPRINKLQVKIVNFGGPGAWLSKAAEPYRSHLINPEKISRQLSGEVVVYNINQ